MSMWEAVLLGLVQGIAEFLPISSSGHLSIVNNLFKISEEGHMFFDVLLHLGTLASIFIVYWQDIKDMFYEVISFANLGPLAGQPRERYPQARTFLMIVMATLPLVLILPINDMIETLYYNNVFIGVAIILTGCMLYVSDRMRPGKKTERSMTILDAVIIGLCQCVATIPGLSRSGATITAGIATGLDRTFAMKYSFLLSLPAVLGANLLSFIKAIGEESIEASLIPAYLLGMLAAMLSGIAAISLMKLIAKKSKFGWFAYYCWGAGLLTIVLSLTF